MLYLDRPIGPIRGLQIYRDHADPNQFYYVPERPRLAMNEGVPEFIFLKYARDITDNPNFSPEQKQALGGGLLAFTVDLSVDESILEEIKSELSEYSGGGAIALSPIMFEDGQVRLTVIKQGGEEGEDEVAGAGAMKIFEETWGATKPSLYGNNRATFGVALSQEGATLMEAALKRGISFVGVVYDLQFLGMRPAFNVKVTADYHRIYNHFEAELGVQAQIKAVTLGADIGVGLQWLEDQGAIKVEVTRFTDDEDLKRQAEEAVKWAKAKIAEDLFQSSLQPPSFMTRSRTDPLSALLNAFGSGLGGAVRTVMPNPRTPASSAGSSPPPERPRPAPTPSSNGGGGGGSGGESPPSSGSDRSRLESRTDHVASPESQQEAGQAGAPQADAGSLMPFRVAFSLKFYRQEELKKRVFEYSMQAAEKRTAAPQGLFTTLIEGINLADRIISVNLDDDFFKRLTAEYGVLCDWEHDGISLVNIGLEYPGGLEDGEQPIHVDGDTFTPADNQRKIFTSWLDSNKDMSYRYKADVHFASNSPWIGKESVLHGDWQQTRDRQLVFNPLDEIGLMNVTITADNSIDFEEVQQVVVQAEYDDPENDFRAERSFLLDKDHRTAEWKLRLSNRRHRTYRWRATYSLKDNVVATTDWINTDDPTAIVSSPFLGRRRIRLVPTLRSDEIIEAVVDIAYQGDSGYQVALQEVFTPDNLRGRTVTIDTLLKDPRSYRYNITVIRADGSFYESGETESDSGVLIVDDKEGQVVSLNIRLLADAARWAELYAVELQIQGTAGITDSLVFTESLSTPRSYSIGLPAGESLEYRWKTIAYRKDGSREEGELQTEHDRELVVQL